MDEFDINSYMSANKYITIITTTYKYYKILSSEDISNEDQL